MTPPSHKIANEDYYRILKNNKDFKKKEKDIKRREERALATVLGVSSPSKVKQEITRIESPDAHPEGESFFDLDSIELPRETLYMIDKVVRQRASKGLMFGADFSELLNEEDLRQSKLRNKELQRLVDGQGSASKVIDL